MAKEANPTAVAPSAPGEHLMSERPAPVPRPEKASLDEFFGSPNPAPKPEEPKPPAPKPPVEPEKPIVESEKPKEPTSELTKPEKEEEDLDSIMESVKPQRKKPKPEAPTAEVQEFKGPKELREAYHRVKSEAEQFRKEIETLKSDSGKLKEYVDAIDKLKNERDDLAKKLEFADYRESPAFQERFQKPMREATERAVALVQKLKHQIEDRAGKAEDVYAIYQDYIQDPANAASKAEEAFGSAQAALLMRKIDDIVAIDSSSRSALDEWNKTSQGRRAMQAAEMEKQRQFFSETFGKQLELEEMATGEVLGINEDPKFGALYGKTKQLVNLAFFPQEGTSREQLVRHSAKVASMAAALPVALMRIDALEKQIEQLKGEVGEYEDAKPRIKPTGDGDKRQSKKAGVEALDDYFAS